MSGKGGDIEDIAYMYLTYGLLTRSACVWLQCPDR